MAHSLFASLLSTLDKPSIGEVAGVLGDSEQTVSRGMESCVAAILAGLTAKSHDTSGLSNILDLAPSSYGDVTWSRAAASASDPGSPLVSGGKRVLAALFGNEEATVAGAISKDSGLRPSATSTLLVMTAPLVMNFLARRLQEQGLSISDLGTALRGESTTMRNALPAGLSDFFWPHAAAGNAASPVVVAQAVEKERASTWSSIAPLAFVALALALFWLFARAHHPAARINLSGTANRAAAGINDLGEFITQKLPNNTVINVPAKGLETRVLTFVQDPRAMPDQNTWFVFDRLQFVPGSATLQPTSQEQINNIAAILAAYPRVRVRVGGYTDNVGGAEQNRQLSQQRANSVVVALVHKGISPDRLIAEGYGEQNPIASNSTEEGRAQNRRVSMWILQK